MKYLKGLIILWLIICISNQSFSQQKEDLSPATPNIGEKCPDYTFHTIINSDLKNAKISSFRGKYLILDFWGTWCGSCVSAIPREDSLQKRYREKLQFLMISSEKAETVQKFFTKANKAVKLSLPSAIDRSWKLAQLFNVYYLPHYIWIDSKGEIQAITGPEEVTNANVHKFIDGVALDLPIKEDEQLNLNFEIPLLMDTSKAKKITLTSYSMMSPYIPGFPPSTGMPNFPKYLNRRFDATNVSVSTLYSSAYGGNFTNHDFPTQRTVLKLKDSIKYRCYTSLISGNKFLHKYGVCYDLIVPEADTALLFKTMRQDLERLYGLKVSIKKQPMPCNVLKIINPGLLHTTGEKAFEESNQLSISLKNQPIKTLCEAIYDATVDFNMAAVIDETNCKSNIDVEIHANLRDRDALNKALSKYGLTLSYEKRNIDILILTEK